ncbi:hypothetical protein PC116_g20164 [Phytophthora cactorum]|nr:hypothetical protein PC116_g20164 [Phytophthora cactorum]
MVACRRYHCGACQWTSILSSAIRPQRQLRRVGASAANPRGEPAKRDGEVFAEAGPVPSSTVSRTLHSPGHPIFLSRAKRTAGAPKGRSNQYLSQAKCADAVISMFCGYGFAMENTVQSS